MAKTLAILLVSALLVPVCLTAAAASPRPLVLWHGLGDSYASPGMLEFASMIKNVHPGIFIHSIYIEEELDKDRQAGFYGNVNTQLDLVANQLANILELKNGFDGIGFSQGGQFLRAYVERYNSPPVHNLLTFGSQHMGISDIPTCRPYDFICQAARRATKKAVYSPWAQANLVQAQYFRDPANLETYLTASSFLPSINNEYPLNRNQTYSKNLASLNALVLIMFTQDKTVVPKESAWFGSEVVDSFSSSQRVLRPVSSRSIIPMHLQPLYIEDWIGLRALDEKGGVIFDTCEGEHMQIGDCWEIFVRNWIGNLVEIQVNQSVPAVPVLNE
ncbi:palmitoyl-protein thioesterase [Lentinula edodes]|nr:palmitoyl-protein thioesterase [Lentinula edodes]